MIPGLVWSKSWEICSFAQEKKRRTKKVNMFGGATVAVGFGGSSGDRRDTQSAP